MPAQCGTPKTGLRQVSLSRAPQRLHRLRALSLLLAAAVTLQACGSDEDVRLEPVPGFDGMVATGEPNAALVGRAILADGGTVADAAVAVSLALAVTYPSRISLGGGGVCILLDRERKLTEALSFLPLSSPAGGVPPGLTRGLEALHARYGGLQWPQLVAPAENLARFGFKTSRALAADIVTAQATLSRNQAAASIFLPNGRPLATGQVLRQPTLARTLSGVRAQSSNLFLTGNTGPTLAKESTALGLRLDETDLRIRVPEYQVPLQIQSGTDYIYLTPPPAANGLVAGEIYQLLTELADYEDADPGHRDHLFLEASAQSFADRSPWVSRQNQQSLQVASLLDPTQLAGRLGGIGSGAHKPASSLSPSPTQVVEPLAGTAFVVGDRYGNALACSLTNNGLFGSGRMAPSSGILLAAPPPDNLVVSPVAGLITSIGTQRARMAVAASGGAAGATALARLILDVTKRELSLPAAMREVRVHHNGLPDVAFVEDRIDSGSERVLIELGHNLQKVPGLGDVQAWYCPDGILQKPELCAVETDPRGFGLSTLAP